jgi:hypothetical protein
MYLKTKCKILFIWLKIVYIHMYLSGPLRAEGWGRKLPWAPTLIGPQLESKSLKLSRFFKLVREFFKLRAAYRTSTCSLVKV